MAKKVSSESSIAVSKTTLIVAAFTWSIERGSISVTEIPLKTDVT